MKTNTKYKRKVVRVTTLCKVCDKKKEYTLTEVEPYPDNFWNCDCRNEVVVIAEIDIGVVDE